MRFSVLATFSGVSDDPEYAYETEYDDIRRTCRECGIEFDETEIGDSEYMYCAAESIGDRNGLESFLVRLCETIAADTGVELPPEDDRGFEWYREFLREHSDSDDIRGMRFWERFAVRGRDLTVSTVMDRETFSRWIDGIGAFAEDVETMGTLGGPLSGGFPSLVADISFRMESSALIESVRVTPFPSFEPQSDVCNRPENWERVRSATLAIYGN